MLAAGAGTRLAPLTRLLPKALCPVGNRPLVDYALERVQRHTADVAVNVHAHPHRMRSHLDGRAHLSLEEPEALGTAGALGNLRTWIDERPVLVTNADAWLRDDLSRLLGGWDGERVRLLVVDDPERGDFGRYRYAGACLLPWSVTAQLDATPSGLYEVCWRQEYQAGRLDFYLTDQTFIDCGTPRNYLAANMDWSGGRNVIGADAIVEGDLTRCVVWPGGVVAAGETLKEVIRVGTDLTVSGE